MLCLHLIVFKCGNSLTESDMRLLLFPSCCESIAGRSWLMMVKCSMFLVGRAGSQSSCLTSNDWLLWVSTEPPWLLRVGTFYQRTRTGRKYMKSLQVRQWWAGADNSDLSRERETSSDWVCVCVWMCGLTSFWTERNSSLFKWFTHLSLFIWGLNLWLN